MIQKIRESKITKILSSYLALQLIIQMFQPTAMWALTGGPKQPEFNSFTPIGTSDMVDLSSGDFSYNIPIMDVGGYPLNLSYQSGITMDQEASWVGLGWNLNVGQINRNVRGIPDDFKGDKIRYENDLRDNVTVGSVFGLGASLFGVDVLQGNIGLGVDYNNYTGFSFRPSFGLSFAITDQLQLGMSVTSATGEGATVTPSVKLSSRLSTESLATTSRVSLGIGVGLNSRKGVENMSITPSAQSGLNLFGDFLEGEDSGGIGGSVSFNDQNNITPSKRIGLNNWNATFAASGGVTIFGVQAQGQITGYASVQNIKDSDKDKNTPAYGYSHTEAAEQVGGVLDFTREKDRSVSDLTKMLPLTNYTYDLYSVQGQGISGMFRPHRSQISYVYDPKVNDSGSSTTLGAEFGGGNLFYAGLEFKHTNSTTRTGLWQTRNTTLPNLEYQKSDRLDYEKVYYKNIGEGTVDRDISLYNNLKEEAPIALNISGGNHVKKLNSVYHATSQNSSETFAIPSEGLQRSNRYLRNQNIEMITQAQALDDTLIDSRATDDFVEAHHNVGAKILKPDGSYYIFGEAAYNIEKVEATFDVSARSNPDCTTGLISYNGSIKGNGNSASNEFLNRITTPAYAHTYLLTSILSSDYEDLKNDGPTNDDLGSYTKFEYTSATTDGDYYQWRVPYQRDMASYNEGLKSNPSDQTGNYIYGKKELKYVSKIETKTHVAIFDLSDRADGVGVDSERGGMPATPDAHDKMQQLDRIYLLSKPEYYKVTDNESIDFLEDLTEKEKQKASIKIAHFKYVNTLLCNGIPNNINDSEGKLALEKVYFTYRDSYMGKYTPYKFEYNSSYTNTNGTQTPFDYNLKGYDIWANYKANEATSCALSSPLSPQEFPFVTQDADIADAYTSAWNIKAIDLPSGGRISLETESDDYQYVQEERAMRMFKVAGIGNTNAPTSESDFDNVLYDNYYLYVKIKEEQSSASEISELQQNFLKDYFDNDLDAPMYFRFLMNMTQRSGHYDYVEGYTIPQSYNVFSTEGATYVALELDKVSSEGSLFNTGAFDTNPIAKAGWYFGRTYLNKIVYGNGDVRVDDPASAIQELVNSMAAIEELIKGPNGLLKDKGCAKNFIEDKSWIRMHEPTGSKKGGGMRVKELRMYDRWNIMAGLDAQYGQYYGQQYEYTIENESSSGVATFEPNSSNENPLVQPFYDKTSTSYVDKIASPSENNYVKLPIGEAFYPSAKVTYSKVRVKNLERKQGDKEVKKHATGSVVSEFYTTKDFPTISTFTDINSNGFDPANKLSNLLKFNVQDHLVFSQGFSVVINDMNAKQKSQWVYPEGSDEPISGVEYEYNQKEGSSNELDNSLLTISETGEVSNQLIGQHYDVVNDFRESYSNVEVAGINSNLTSFLVAIFPSLVPFPLPSYANHTNILRLATTTKVIHKTGILKKKTAYDLGAKVATENIAWDANTGQVLLTKTENEFNDHYYNFNYPAYWAYKGMGMASQNIGVEGTLLASDSDYFTGDVDLLQLGDELFNKSDAQKYWIVAKPNISRVTLMNAEGHVVNAGGDCIDYELPLDDFEYRIVRSGYRNQQTASMASFTSLVNPITEGATGTYTITNPTESSRVVNASAIEYNEYWEPQNELNLPVIKETTLTEEPENYGFNPYLYNVNGDFRAKASYAYLTGRNADTDQNPDTKNSGFFNDFKPFYTLATASWTINATNKESWTAASQVAKFSPFGAELENKDALDRYSAAQYGYNYTLPIAVASNSKYQEIAFDGFEDYSEELQESYNYEKRHFDVPLIEGITESIASITTEESHTGTKSLAVEPNESISITRSLGDCFAQSSTCGEEDEILAPELILAEYIFKVNEDDSENSVFESNTGRSPVSLNREVPPGQGRVPIITTKIYLKSEKFLNYSLTIESNYEHEYIECVISATVDHTSNGLVSDIDYTRCLYYYDPSYPTANDLCRFDQRQSIFNGEYILDSNGEIVITIIDKPSFFNHAQVRDDCDTGNIKGNTIVRFYNSIGEEVFTVETPNVTLEHR